MRKIKIALVACFLLFANLTMVFAIDFNDDNEVQYLALCNGDNLSAENKEICREFQRYLNTKLENENSQLGNIQKQIEEIRAKLKESNQKVEEYQKKISSLKLDIDNLTNKIVEVENQVVVLEATIVEREATINELTKKVEDRLVSNQSTMRLNQYIDFIMGAKSFTDLIRIVEGVNDMMAYDKKELLALQEEIKQLNADKEELSYKKEDLVEKKKSLDLSKKNFEALKSALDTVIAEFEKNAAALEAQGNIIAGNLDAIRDKLNSVSDALGEIIVSKGWTTPTASGEITSGAGTWYYSSGGIHLGADFRSGIGTTIRAAANGYILASYDSCPTYGGLGSSCGAPGSTGGGNQVYLLTNVNGVTYAVKYLHMKSGTPIAMGTFVNAGDKVGEVGSSGNSSGAHCHVEVFKLGTMSIQTYAKNWNGVLHFGAGYGSNGIANRCSSTGGSAPCRMKPESIFGV